MRISTAQIFNGGLAGILNASEQAARTQEQISSGRRILTPSDDPVASARILEAEAELAASAQYQRNIDNVEGRLLVAEDQIASVEEVILRVNELVLQAANGTQTNETRGLIAVEIRQRLEQLEGLVNARDANGDYIFSGFRTDTPAFALQGNQYVYQGDEGQRFEQIANGLRIAANETGMALFADVPISSNDVLISAASTNSSDAAVVRGDVVDQALYDAVAPTNFRVTFNPLGNVAPAGPNYTVTTLPSGDVVLADQPYAPGDVISFNGIEIELSAAPDPGDVIEIDATQSRDMLTTIRGIADNLTAFDNADDRKAFVDTAIDDIRLIQQTLSQGRSRIGSSLNTLEDTRASQQSLDVFNQSVVSQLRDLDYAEAISRLSFQTFVLEAAQSSFSRVANLSLFNFLR